MTSTSVSFSRVPMQGLSNGEELRKFSLCAQENEEIGLVKCYSVSATQRLCLYAHVLIYPGHVPPGGAGKY
jgi:hypothetical protein